MRPEIHSAQVVVSCTDVDANLSFFTDRLGFRVDAIFPADLPRTAVVSGYGTCLRLVCGDDVAGNLRLVCGDAATVGRGQRSLTAPNGTRIELVDKDPALLVPPIADSFVLTRLAEDCRWGAGRAGMQYRDLIPNRLGGRFIASHIRIPAGGDVPDYPHFHRVRFQTIYCYKGWVRVVYEDQGEPFVLRAGDCVLQPSTIRHRVLESSPGLEVIEVSCPADHETFADHEIDLPTDAVRPERTFGGHRFVRHVAAEALWTPWRKPGFECRAVGVAEATDGLGEVRVVRPIHVGDDHPDGRSDELWLHEAELVFWFVLVGEARLLRNDGKGLAVAAGDAAVIPAGMDHRLDGLSRDFELLEVSLPAIVAERSTDTL